MLYPLEPNSTPPGTLADQFHRKARWLAGIRGYLVRRVLFPTDDIRTVLGYETSYRKQRNY